VPARLAWVWHAMPIAALRFWRATTVPLSYGEPIFNRRGLCCPARFALRLSQTLPLAVPLAYPDAICKSRFEALCSSEAEVRQPIRLYEWDWSGSQREFRRALELRPNYATAHHWYAHYLAAVRRVDEAVAEMKRARELDPFGITVNIWLATTLYYSRQYDQAIQQYRRTLELYPDWWELHKGIGDCYSQKGQVTEAVGEWQKTLQLEGEDQLADSLRQAYASGGYIGYLQERLHHLTASAHTKPAAPLEFAYTYARLGEKEHALEWLERSYNERDPWLYVKAEPILDGLRAEQRFKDLLRRMGLPP
jgi:tetratricopeptide (TPR) repeat protein